jgi:hypothetical protein
MDEPVVQNPVNATAKQNRPGIGLNRRPGGYQHLTLIGA